MPAGEVAEAQLPTDPVKRWQTVIPIVDELKKKAKKYFYNSREQEKKYARKNKMSNPLCKCTNKRETGIANTDHQSLQLHYNEQIHHMTAKK